MRTRRNLPDCWPWILSWSAIPGSPVSQTWPKWYSSANGWSRFSTSGRPSANSAKNSDTWCRTRSEESKQPSSCLTVVSASPKIPAPAVPTSGLCLGRPDLTEAALVRRPGADDLDIGLTSLRTRIPPNAAQAQSQTGLISWPGRRYLCELSAGQYWRLEELKSFDEFLARWFPESRRKAYYLMSIHEHLPPQARKDLKEL